MSIFLEIWQQTWNEFCKTSIYGDAEVASSYPPVLWKAWHPWIWVNLDKFTCLLVPSVIWFYGLCCFRSLLILTFHVGWLSLFLVLLNPQRVLLHVRSDPRYRFFSCSGKRKALKLNFANPPIKPTTRFTLNTAGPPFQNPHMWVNLRPSSWYDVRPAKQTQGFYI